MHFRAIRHTIRREARFKGCRERQRQVLGRWYFIVKKARLFIVAQRVIFKVPFFEPGQGGVLWNDHISNTFIVEKTLLFDEQVSFCRYRGVVKFLRKMHSHKELRAQIYNLIRLVIGLSRRGIAMEPRVYARVVDYFIGYHYQSQIFKYKKIWVLFVSSDISTKNLALALAAKKKGAMVLQGQVGSTHFSGTIKSAPPYYPDVVLFKSSHAFKVYGDKVVYYDARKGKRHDIKTIRRVDRLGVAVDAKISNQRIIENVRLIAELRPQSSIIFRPHPSKLTHRSWVIDELAKVCVIDYSSDLALICSCDLVVVSQTSVAGDIIYKGVPVVELASFYDTQESENRLFSEGKIPRAKVPEDICVDLINEFYMGNARVNDDSHIDQYKNIILNDRNLKRWVFGHYQEVGRFVCPIRRVEYDRN